MGNQLEQTQQPHIHEILNILNVMMKILILVIAGLALSTIQEKKHWTGIKTLI